MNRYNDYENWDEYEDEGIDDEGIDDEGLNDGVREEDRYEEDGEEEEAEEEEEEEAPHQPTQQELDFLELRKQIKEGIRKQMKKENGSSLGHSQERKKKLPYDNYGSFFGPSQPVIAQRVIQESKSLLENERLTTKVLKPNHSSKTSASTSSHGRPKNTAHVSRPKTVNQLKSRVENLKSARDYSFLLSDDAELPTSSKDPPRNVSRGPTSDARSAQVPPKNKQLPNSNGRVDQRQVQNGSRKVHSESRQASSGSRPASNGNRLSSNGDRQTSNGTKQVSSGNRQVSNGREERKNVPSAGNLHHRTDPHKLNSVNKQISKPADSRKQLLNNNGSGPGRPMPSKPLPSKAPPAATIQKKVPLSGTRPNSSAHCMPKPSSTKLQSSALKQPIGSKQSTGMKQPLDQRNGYQDSRKILSKQPVLSKHQVVSKPTTKAPSRPPLEKDHLKKRPARPFQEDDDDFDGDVSSMIRKLMGYNPDKYKGRDLDDKNMEANLNDIWREEKRSEKIAKLEDEEELRKQEEEEERERLRKAKKRKLSH